MRDLGDAPHAERAGAKVDRRTFLNVTAGLPIATLFGGALMREAAAASAATADPVGQPGWGTANAGPVQARAASLQSLAESVLPTEIGPGGRAAAVSDFERWLNQYLPGVEQNHGYGSGRIQFGSASDPRPVWRDQLAALDASALSSHGQPFDSLNLADRTALVRSAIEEAGAQRLGSPLSAPHVAVALLSWWCASPAAHDLAQRARIGKETCRPLAGVEQRPVLIERAR